MAWQAAWQLRLCLEGLEQKVASRPLVEMPTQPQRQDLALA